MMKATISMIIIIGGGGGGSGGGGGGGGDCGGDIQYHKAKIMRKGSKGSTERKKEREMETILTCNEFEPS